MSNSDRCQQILNAIRWHPCINSPPTRFRMMPVQKLDERGGHNLSALSVNNRSLFVYDEYAIASKMRYNDMRT